MLNGARKAPILRSKRAAPTPSSAAVLLVICQRFGWPLSGSARTSGTHPQKKKFDAELAATQRVLSRTD